MILLVGAALGFAVFAYLILFSIPSTFRHFDPVSSPWLQVASGVTMATVTAIVFAVITLVLLVIATIRRSSRIFGAIGLTLALIGGTVMIPMSAMRTATAVQFSAQHTVLRLVDKFDWHTLSLPEAEEMAGYFSHLLEHTKISPATLHTYIPDSAWQALPDEAREVLEGVLGARPHTKDG